MKNDMSEKHGKWVCVGMISIQTTTSHKDIFFVRAKQRKIIYKTSSDKHKCGFRMGGNPELRPGEFLPKKKQKTKTSV